MRARIDRPVDYWQQIERVVASKVDAAMQGDAAARRPLILYLRNLEQMARAECDRRQTLQIIASGRRLLGDSFGLVPDDGPFAGAPA